MRKVLNKKQKENHKLDIYEELKKGYKSIGRTYLWGAIAIGTIFVILVTAIIICSIYTTKQQDQNWNDGICPKCGGTYELFTVDENNWCYVCNECGHECVSYKSRR